VLRTSKTDLPLSKGENIQKTLEFITDFHIISA